MTPTQLFLASRKAARAGNKAEAARLRAEYLAALKSDPFTAYRLPSRPTTPTAT